MVIKTRIELVAAKDALCRPIPRAVWIATNASICPAWTVPHASISSPDSDIVAYVQMDFGARIANWCRRVRP